jgi:hypothetical protein
MTVNKQQTESGWPVTKENDPPPDLSRENAAFERERERLVRDHLGKIALIHDEVIGAFATLEEAVLEGYRRFGFAPMVYRPITAVDEPEFIPHVDVNHPCCRRLDG